VDQRSAADLDPKRQRPGEHAPILRATAPCVLRGWNSSARPPRCARSCCTTSITQSHHGPVLCTVPRSRRTSSSCADDRRGGRRTTPGAGRALDVTPRQALGFTLAPRPGSCCWRASETTSVGLARELEKLAPLCPGRPASRDECRLGACAAARHSRFHRRGPRAARSGRRRLVRSLCSSRQAFERTSHAQRRSVTALRRDDAGPSGARTATRGDAIALEGALLRQLRAARPYGLGSLGADRAPLGSVDGALDRGRAAPRAAAGPRRDRALKSSTLTDEGGILEQLVLSWACARGSGMRVDGWSPLRPEPVRLCDQIVRPRLDRLRRKTASPGRAPACADRPDSARAMVRRCSRDCRRRIRFTGVLFTAGRVASDERPPPRTQRVVVEYPRSVWADSGLVLLTQLYFAQGDPRPPCRRGAAASRYPDSPLRARANFWGARLTST